MTASDEGQLPEDVSSGRRTPTFTNASVPQALLSAHVTNAWAELIVFQGTVRFFDEDSDWGTIATPASSVLIVPHRRHRIEPGPDAEFAVQFYDDPPTEQPAN